MTSPAPTTSTPQFRPASVNFNKTLTKEERQDQGIFFTPLKIRTRLFEVLQLLNIRPTSILEPSFGSGEFIDDVLETWPDAFILGVEKNKALYTSYEKKLGEQTPALLYNMDFLDFSPQWKVSLSLGNPPYFVTQAKNPACMVGRGNIFVEFIYKTLTQHLLPNGHMAFILPTSFYTCSYYQPCRDYIIKYTTILHLENLESGFYDTLQDTMLIVVQNTLPKIPAFSFCLHGQHYISPNAKELADITKGTTTLSKLGLNVKTGDVVWNQEKPSLHETEGTLVIYMNNIVNNTLVLNNFPQPKNGERSDKKQRIKDFKRKPMKGPAIVVSRGYGNAHYKISYVFIPEGHEEFYGENHTNVITAINEESKKNFARVCASFNDPRTARFLDMFVGNCALSKTELESVLPIF